MAQDTPQAVRELLQKMHEERLAFLQAVSSITEEQANAHPGGGWSLKQQLAHLVEAERGYRGWALTAL
mgnify:CR=1 FL=1